METWKLRVTGLWVGNSQVTGEFPAQMASNAENVSISWRHHIWDVFFLVQSQTNWFYFVTMILHAVSC